MNIEKAHLINKNALDERAYLESLLEAAEKVQLITNSDIESIQDGCMEILARNLERTYGGMSDSVSEERAKSMMDSVIYTVGVGLKAYSDADTAVMHLKQKGAEAVYMLGIKRIKEMLAGIKDMLDILQNNMPQEPNPFYFHTVTKTLPAFLKRYNPEIAAHECMVYPDYPVSFPLERFAGIEYIFAYTVALLKEKADG